MIFTEEQTEEIEKLAGINYTIKQIAMYLDINPVTLQNEYFDETSKFRYHYDRGKLVSQALVDMDLNKSAQGGNMTAKQQFERVRQLRQFENTRDQMLNGN